MIKTGILGNRAEKLAASYLRKAGMTLVERNFRCRLGELDLIMLDQDYLVFVEVRHRKSQNYGGALESVDARKQTKLRRAAESYMLKTNQFDHAARFDVVCVDGDLSRPNFQWIKNAF